MDQAQVGEEKQHSVTVAGDLGAGKSTVSKRLALLLGYTRKSTGDDMRAIAQERGMSLGDLCALAETDPYIDDELDRRNAAYNGVPHLVLEARLGFHFVKISFKVFLSVGLDEAARRILADSALNPSRAVEASGVTQTLEGVKASILERVRSEDQRYRDRYGIQNYRDPKHFDLVVQTDSPAFNGNPDAVAQHIKEEYEAWLKDQVTHPL